MVLIHLFSFSQLERKKAHKLSLSLQRRVSIDNSHFKHLPTNIICCLTFEFKHYTLLSICCLSFFLDTKANKTLAKDFIIERLKKEFKGRESFSREELFDFY